MNKPRKPLPAKKAVAKSAAKVVAAKPSLSEAQAQQKADTTAAFLREVDEAMRVEKWQNRWVTWRLPLACAVATLIAGTAAWQGFQAWQQHQQRTVAAKWDEISRVKDKTELAASLKEFAAQTGSQTPGYAAMAKLAEAAQATSPLEKLTAYRALAADTALPEWLSNIGALNAAVLLLESSPAEGKAQLELLTKTTLGQVPAPTAPVALELLALHAMQANDAATAKAYTQRLLQLPEQGGVLTPAMRQRALQRMGALGGM